MGAAEDRAFMMNQMQPYEERATAKRSLMGAGIQNILKGAELGAAMEMQGGRPAAASTNQELPNQYVQGGSMLDFMKYNGNRVKHLNGYIG